MRCRARPHSTTDCSCADAGESRETKDRRGVRSLSDRDDEDEEEEDGTSSARAASSSSDLRDEDEDDDGARDRVRERGVDAREGF